MSDSTATTIHLHKPYSGSWTVCGNDEVPASETTERLSETTCPRCFHDGDPVPRTRALTVERAYAEALTEDGERTERRTSDELETAALVGEYEPTVPADVADDAAWTVYCAALPEPTDGELAAVMVEFHNPYADQITHAEEGFRTSARMIWSGRTNGGHAPLDYRYLRAAMNNYASIKRTYQALAEASALLAASDMHLAASVEGADAYAVTFE